MRKRAFTDSDTPIAKAAAELSRLLIEYDYSQDEGLTLLQGRMILDVLAAKDGNQCKAARALRVHRNTLSRQIVELRLEGRVAEMRSERERKKLAQAAKPKEPETLRSHREMYERRTREIA
jgi:hypothetical protein